ncbi:MAG: hypothetical protein N2691_03270 [Patescibacteria group bacterium]|nr:hypothetical protein [Patescibacteria group bacterium]
MQLWKGSVSYIVFILAVVAGFFSLYAIDSYFRISTITVYQSTKSGIPRGIEAFYNSFSLIMNPAQIAREIEQQNPSIRKARVDLQLPDRLDLFLEFHTPAVAIRGFQGDIILADDGTIIEKKREEEKTLPRILHYQTPDFFSYQAGQKYDYTDILSTIYFIRKLGSLGIKVTRAEITDVTRIELYAGEQVFRFTMEKERELQAYQVERLIKELAISGQKYSTIDLRFEKPVFEPLP